MSSPARYRIFHATDLHFQCAPTLAQLLRCPKRWIGAFNLYVMGRASTFSLAVQQSIVGEVFRHSPTHVIITGDLTTLATEQEFSLARQTLAPLLSEAQPESQPRSFSTHIIRGNHDVYTREALALRLFEKFFGSHQCPTAQLTSVAPGLTIFAMDPCRPTSLGSNGLYSETQLSSLAQSLSSQSHSSSPSLTLLLTHYPILDRSGVDYQSKWPWHGVTNNSKLIDTLRQHFNANILAMHGHDHHGYYAPFTDTHTDSGNGSQSFPIYNPGSSGWSYQRGKRAAAYNIYTVEQTNDRDSGVRSSMHMVNGANVHVMPGWRVTVERFLHNGEQWERESAPYQSEQPPR